MILQSIFANDISDSKVIGLSPAKQPIRRA